MSGSMSATIRCCTAGTLSNTQAWIQIIGEHISIVLAEFRNNPCSSRYRLRNQEILHLAHIWQNIVKVSLFGAGFLHLLF